eukprot:scaffold141126_cov75-Phaeocystis_antarctica.AAC.1
MAFRCAHETIARCAHETSSQATTVLLPQLVLSSYGWTPSLRPHLMLLLIPHVLTRPRSSWD